MPKKPEMNRGSGSNPSPNPNRESDGLRDQDQEDRLDKMDEDSFPASDAPSRSPMTGVGRMRESRKMPESRDTESLDSSDDTPDPANEY